MNKELFYKIVFEKIANATAKKDKGNVLDLRLFKAPFFDLDNIYGLNEVDELYDKLKHYDGQWFIDIYENIVDANYAEFIDECIWFDEITNPQPKKVKITIEMETLA